MKLHEYQAKSILARYGIQVPRGSVAFSPAEVLPIASDLNGTPQHSEPTLESANRVSKSKSGFEVVLKAQVHAGGRGKAGGIKKVTDPAEVPTVATQLLGTTLFTEQTGSDGIPVKALLVESSIAVDREIYVSIVTDGAKRRPVVVVSSSGGEDIEEVARTTPENIITEVIDPTVGFLQYQGRRLANAVRLDRKLFGQFIGVLEKCYKVFRDNDCTLVEINPLVVSGDTGLVALDAKISVDDDALFRHPDLVKLHDDSQEDPLETTANKYDISYIRLSGSVGCMVNGAGLAMATMDTIKMAGAEPANFLDVGGGASEEKVAHATSIMLADPQVTCILVNLFGGILRCDLAARGILAGYEHSDRKPPLVIRMLGTHADEGKDILARSDLPIVFVDSLAEAAKELNK